METFTPVSGSGEKNSKLMINLLGYFRVVLLAIFIYCRKKVNFCFLKWSFKVRYFCQEVPPQ